MHLFDPQLLAFTAVVAVLTVSPGADTMLVIRNVLARGPKAGVLTSLGIGGGVFVHATLSALGLSLILVRSSAAFEIVKLAGAAYLVYLGARSIVQALNTAEDQTSPLSGPVSTDQPGSHWRSVSEGMFTNLLNPKVAIFYLAFLPQFIRPGEAVLARSMLMATIHCLLGLVWLSVVSYFLGRARMLLTRPVVRRWLEAASGSILVAFGVRLLLEKQR